jgi:glucose-1-phosphatase
MLNLTGIKNIIFDFGGVILNIDFQKTVDAFKKVGLNNFDQLYSQYSQTDLFDKLEKGLVEPVTFHNEIRKLSGLSLSDEQIDTAWNDILLDLPAKRIELLLKLKNRYNTYLLSNSNIIHYWKYRQNLEDVHGYPDFDALFKKAWFSFNVGMRKPDLEIYKCMLKNENLLPSETLFIDDSYPNLVAAQQLGIQIYHLQKGEDITSLFTL